jgi:thioredoxin-like negative regulator of GroEL
MMAPQLQQAAAETFKDKIRVAKMDSDKHPQMAGHLRVGGLPTLILFNNGKEVDRLEGALMKDQLVQWVNGKL